MGTAQGGPRRAKVSSRLIGQTEKTIQAIKEVANDPASEGAPSFRGRTEVRGTRDGVDIEVIVGADGKTIILAYPTNAPRNPEK